MISRTFGSTPDPWIYFHSPSLQYRTMSTFSTYPPSTTARHTRFSLSASCCWILLYRREHIPHLLQHARLHPHAAGETMVCVRSAIATLRVPPAPTPTSMYLLSTTDLSIICSMFLTLECICLFSFRFLAHLFLLYPEKGAREGRPWRSYHVLACYVGRLWLVPILDLIVCSRYYAWIESSVVIRRRSYLHIHHDPSSRPGTQ